MNRISSWFVRVVSVLACFIALIGLVAAPAHAQSVGAPTSPILTIESDRLYSQSLFGQRIAREVEADGTVLSDENRRIEAELTAEEQDLTDRRPEMEADAFRALAEAFDQKVQESRRTQDNKARALAQRRDAARVAFFRAARPVLEDLMVEIGATIVLERASVFLSANATDVTDMALEHIDAAIGDGASLDSADDPAAANAPTLP